MHRGNTRIEEKLFCLHVGKPMEIRFKEVIKKKKNLIRQFHSSREAVATRSGVDNLSLGNPILSLVFKR